MKTIISSAVAIYILQEGEKLKRSQSDRDYSRFYVIYPSGVYWKIFYFPYGDKNRIELPMCTSENEAFNLAYEHLIDNAKKFP